MQYICFQVDLEPTRKPNKVEWVEQDNE